MKKIRDFIIEKYGRDLIYPMSALRDEELFEEIMNWIIQRTGRIYKVVEIGTYIGVSSIFLARFADVVYTFDTKKYDLMDSIFKEYPTESKKVKFYQVGGDVEKRDIIDKLDFDFAFIDGRHFGVAFDFEICKKCRRILFHDYERGFPENNLRTHVVSFVDSLGDDVILKREPFAFWSKR